MIKTLMPTFIVIILIGTLPQVASDIYAPALPVIANEFRVPLSQVQLSMAIYLLGVALSLFIYGPLSEGFGRRGPLLVGMLISVIGSVVCALAPNGSVLIIGRLMQGAGAGAGAGLWRSIFRDVLEGDKLAEYSSYLTIAVMFVIPAAPLVGGYLSHYLSWRAIFIFIIIYSLVALIAVKTIYQETNRHQHRDRLKLQFIIATYRDLFSHRVFIGSVLCSFCVYGAYFSWFIVSPELLIKHLGISPVVFGWINFLGALFNFATGGFLSGRCTKRFGSEFTLKLSWCLMVVCGVLLGLAYFIFGLNLWAVVIPGIAFSLAAAFFWPNIFASAVTPVGHIAGYAGCCYGALQLGGGAIIGSAISHLPNHSPLALASLYIIMPVASYGIYRFVVKSSNLTN